VETVGGNNSKDQLILNSLTTVREQWTPSIHRSGCRETNTW